MRILKKRKSVPKPYFSNRMLEKSVKKNVARTQQKSSKMPFFAKDHFFGFRASPFFGFLREFVGRVARFVHESWKRLVNASPLSTLFDRPLHLAAVPEAKQSNQNVLSFQLGFCSAIYSSRIGCSRHFGSAHFSLKNRFRRGSQAGCFFLRAL